MSAHFVNNDFCPHKSKGKGQTKKHLTAMFWSLSFT